MPKELWWRTDITHEFLAHIQNYDNYPLKFTNSVYFGEFLLKNAYLLIERTIFFVSDLQEIIHEWVARYKSVVGEICGGAGMTPSPERSANRHYSNGNSNIEQKVMICVNYKFVPF